MSRYEHFRAVPHWRLRLAGIAAAFLIGGIAWILNSMIIFIVFVVAGVICILLIDPLSDALALDLHAKEAGRRWARRVLRGPSNNRPS